MPARGIEFHVEVDPTLETSMTRLLWKRDCYQKVQGAVCI
jgi:hypothetical protein